MVDRIYPFMNGIAKGVKVKKNAFDSYFAEPRNLTEKDLSKILDQGTAWAKKLTPVLASGGSAIFPHTYMSECGYQIAAVVQACIECAADQVLALGVMHPINETLLQARTKEYNGRNISNEPSWGILGPVFKRDACWEQEFSLAHFKFLWEAEARRRGIKPPKLIECYPSLTNRQPDKLPGMKELEKIARDSVVVATDDMCHHGIAYGVPKNDVLQMDEKGLEFASRTIIEGFEYLEAGEYKRYFDHWMNPLAIGDPTDCAIVLSHLLGQASFELMDLKLVDVTRLFEGDNHPSWVAAALIKVEG